MNFHKVCLIIFMYSLEEEGLKSFFYNYLLDNRFLWKGLNIMVFAMVLTIVEKY